MTREGELPEEFLEKLQAVTGKRARIVINHILEHGYITTEDLEKTYGYSHPPRAARDVREQGIPRYWAYPRNYTHIALREVRRTDILWDAAEIQTY